MESVNVGFWSVVPPLIAIVLALVTKEVIFALVVGILSGTVIYSLAIGIGFVGVFSTTTNLMVDKLGGNASMLIFLALLGALVAVITKAGGSRAYGEWASRKLNSKKSASVATAILGMLIFIDDYFNCLTVGTVMRPVTDKHLISREKLAYLIDATAAPVCIIAPISSWAASVMSYFPESSQMSGMQAFLSSIPMNLYALLTLFMVFWVCLVKNADFGPMAKAELKVQKDGVVKPDAQSTGDDELASMDVSQKGKVFDLIIPVAFLIVSCVLAMLYYGGYWTDNVSLFTAFGDTDAGLALSLGGFCSLIVAFLVFVPRKLLTFSDFFAAVGKGVKSMVPAMTILTLAWTISGVCRDLLMTGDYVAQIVQNSVIPVALIPVLMFVIAAILSFSTGTSWGTFGILIPIILVVCEAIAPQLTVTALSSILAGSVLGDHCSPISDTTILSSTGAGCKHIDHVATQLPYVLTVGAVCIVGYLVAGFTNGLGYGMSLGITLVVSLALLVVTLMVLPKLSRKLSA